MPKKRFQTWLKKKTRSEKLENLIEDMELAETYGKDIEQTERQRKLGFETGTEFTTAEDLMRQVEENR